MLYKQDKVEIAHFYQSTLPITLLYLSRVSSRLKFGGGGGKPSIIDNTAYYYYYSVMQ